MGDACWTQSWISSYSRVSPDGVARRWGVFPRKHFPCSPGATAEKAKLFRRFAPRSVSRGGAAKDKVALGPRKGPGPYCAPWPTSRRRHAVAQKQLAKWRAVCKIQLSSDDDRFGLRAVPCREFVRPKAAAITDLACARNSRLESAWLFLYDGRGSACCQAGYCRGLRFRA